MNQADMAAANQDRILRFLLSFTPEQWPPSIREIAEACELAPSTVLKNLRALERQGFIERGTGNRQVRVNREVAA